MSIGLSRVNPVSDFFASIIENVFDLFSGKLFSAGNAIPIIFAFVFLLIMIANLVSMVLCPILAKKKHRSIVGWFFIGFFIGWIGLIIIACLKPKHK